MPAGHRFISIQIVDMIAVRPVRVLIVNVCGFLEILKHHNQRVLGVHGLNNFWVINPAIFVVVKVFSHDSGGMNELSFWNATGRS